MTIEVYTDGACSGNPGIGGWGVVILIDKNNPVFFEWWDKGYDKQSNGITSYNSSTEIFC